MIVAHLRPRIFAPGDWIIRTGDVGDEMYFVSSGAIEIQDSHGHHRTTLGAGDYFGEIVLLLDTTRTASARAATYCDVFALSKKDFGDVLRHFPDMLPVLQRMAEVRIGQDLLRSLLPREKYFSECSPEFLQDIEGKFSLRKFGANETILDQEARESDPHLIFVIAGAAQIVDPAKRVVAKLSVGSFFGHSDVLAPLLLQPQEAKLLLRGLTNCSVRSASDVDEISLFILRSSDLESLLREHRSDATRIELGLRQQLREQVDGSDSIFAAKTNNKKMMESNLSNNKKFVRDEGLLQRRVSTFLLPTISAAGSPPSPGSPLLSREQKKLTDSMKRLSKMSPQSSPADLSGSISCVDFSFPQKLSLPVSDLFHRSSQSPIKSMIDQYSVDHMSPAEAAAALAALMKLQQRLVEKLTASSSS
jgi:CRP-like cAMP-binding protein